MIFLFIPLQALLCAPVSFCVLATLLSHVFVWSHAHLHTLLFTVNELMMIRSVSLLHFLLSVITEKLPEWSSLPSFWVSSFLSLASLWFSFPLSRSPVVHAH